MSDGIVHRDITQTDETVIFKETDPVLRANPDLIPKMFDGIDVGKCADTKCLSIRESVLQLAVDDLRPFGTEIDIPVLLRIRKYRGDHTDPQLISVIEAGHLPVLHGEDRTVHGLTIDHSAQGCTELTDIFIIDLGFIDCMELQIRIDHSHAVSRCDIDIPLGILYKGPDGIGFQIILILIARDLPLLHHGHAVIIGSDPQPVLAVYIEADHTGDTGGGINTFKCISVITDHTTVASDPDEAFSGLRYGIRFRCGKSVGIVVKNRGKALFLTGGIHMDILIFITGNGFRIDRSAVPRTGLSRIYSCRKPQEHHKGNADDPPSAHLPPPGSLIVQTFKYPALLHIHVLRTAEISDLSAKRQPFPLPVSVKDNTRLFYHNDPEYSTKKAEIHMDPSPVRRRRDSNPRAGCPAN